MFIRFSITVLCLLATLTILPAASDPFSDPLIQNIQARHEKGMNGDKAALIALIADLERLTKEQPKNYLLQAYLGSAYTLRSRDIGFGPSAYSNLKAGLKTMDAAVAADQKNPAVRFIRAINNFNLPFFCMRRDNARTDFKILLQQIETPSAEYVLSIPTTQAIYLYAGMSLRQLSEPQPARDALERGLRLDPHSPLAARLQQELSKLNS